MTSITTSEYYSAMGLGSAAGTAAEKAKNDSLGQADFLLLMTTQLQHQDPLKPMDNAQMVSQLAQMSTVQGIDSLNSTLNGFSASMTNDQILKASSLVGHEVLVPSTTMALDESGQAEGVVAAPGPGTLMVDITDASGRVVNTIRQTADSAGELSFAWDGTDAGGNRLPAGKYGMSARFAQNGAEPTSIETYSQAPVESVLIGSDGLYLNLKNLGTTSLDQVIRVS